MAPRFRSSGPMPMEAQMLAQSASRFASVVTIPFGLPVEPEVSLTRRAPAGSAGPPGGRGAGRRPRARRARAGAAAGGEPPFPEEPANRKVRQDRGDLRLGGVTVERKDDQVEL